MLLLKEKPPVVPCSIVVPTWTIKRAVLPWKEALRLWLFLCNWAEQGGCMVDVVFMVLCSAESEDLHTGPSFMLWESPPYPSM